MRTFWLSGAVVVLASATALAFLAPQNPPWTPTYQLNLSTISMVCNQSGWFNEDVGSFFGIPSIDWSNAKQQWANAHPMNDQELMLEQASRFKTRNPASHVFTYANAVKALPWMAEVREKLEDPAYAGWFLRFANYSGGNGSYHVPACTGSKCSGFYHDQEQTPEHPHGDGSCVDPCDCGSLPCGEYLFDHRNESLRAWLVKDYILGPHSAGSPLIDGLFIDDFWCSNIINGSCGDPVQGPSEIDRHSQQDMGLSDEDIADITRGWQQTMTDIQQALLAAGKYTWSLIPGQYNANAMPRLLAQANCADFIRPACSDASPYDLAPLLFGLTTSSDPKNPLPQLDEDIAAFLLARGPYAYAGWGVWGMSWPAGATWQKQGGRVVHFPEQLSKDYGRPVAQCQEIAPNTFQRNWTQATVTLNCTAFQASVEWLGARQ